MSIEAPHPASLTVGRPLPPGQRRMVSSPHCGRGEAGRKPGGVRGAWNWAATSGGMILNNGSPLGQKAWGTSVLFGQKNADVTYLMWIGGVNEGVGIRILGVMG